MARRTPPPFGPAPGRPRRDDTRRRGRRWLAAAGILGATALAGVSWAARDRSPGAGAVARGRGETGPPGGAGAGATRGQQRPGDDGRRTPRPMGPGNGGLFGLPPGHPGTSAEAGHDHDRPDGGPGDAPRRRPWRLHDPVPGTPETRNDPQLAASLNTLSRAGVDPADAFPPREVVGAIADADGPTGIAAGDDCDVRLLPARMGPYGCLARVRCGGRTLYPDSAEKGGFVACELDDDGQPVRAVDERTGLDDGDPTFDYDAALGEVAVTRDDGTRAVIRLRPR